MNKIFNQSSFYLSLVTLCSLNGTLYQIGSSLARGLYILLLLFSIYYAIRTNLKRNLPLYFHALNYFVLFLTLYGVANLVVGGGRYGNMNVTSTSFLFNVYNSLLPVYAFYYFTSEGLLKEKNMKFWFFVFFLLAINTYYQYQTHQRIILDDLNDRFDRLANNASYIFLGLVPAVFFFKKNPVIQYAFLLISGFFIVSSVKRGAILIFAICLVWYIYRSVNTASVKRKRRVMFVSILMIAAAYFYIIYMMDNSAYFADRIEDTLEGDDSGRNSLYNTFLGYLGNETGLLQLLLGNGADGTLKIAGQYAHNDWLEIAIDMGLVGVLIYVVYWVCYFKSWKMYKFDPVLYSSVGMLFIMYFLMTLFSMSFNAVSYGSSYILGYSLAIGQMEQNSQQKA